MILNDAARSVLEGPHVAHVVTLNDDGSPQVSVVWVGLRGDDIVFAHLGRGRKIENLLRDSRVVLSVESGTKEGPALDGYLVVHGTAVVTEGGAPALLSDLAQVYISPGAVFPPMDDPPAGHVVTITPTRVGGVGPW
jgi:PPOX class probable F420-dependent enzyme